MASIAVASSMCEAQNSADRLSGTWKKALRNRHYVVDMLKGAQLQPMADDIGFWAYRLDNAFPADTHNRFVTCDELVI